MMLSLAISSSAEQVVTFSAGEGVFFVERMFLNFYFMWPFAVYSDFGRYLRTKSAVSPGHVEKKPLLMALIHVFGEGLQHVRW